MNSKRSVYVVFDEEEAYELLMRCLSHDEDDNIAFQSAMNKLAEAIKGDLPRAA